uniref:Secreted protein n=1 Tax=Brugia timori TaxID=42155 RepID=A0A0R3QLF1_9BILA
MPQNMFHPTTQYGCNIIRFCSCFFFRCLFFSLHLFEFYARLYFSEIRTCIRNLNNGCLVFHFLFISKRCNNDGRLGSCCSGGDTGYRWWRRRRRWNRIRRWSDILHCRWRRHLTN